MPDLANGKVGDNQVLPTDEKDVARLEIVNEILWRAGERAMLPAGIAQDARVADISCGAALCIFITNK